MPHLRYKHLKVLHTIFSNYHDATVETSPIPIFGGRYDSTRFLPVNTHGLYRTQFLSNDASDFPHYSSLHRIIIVILMMVYFSLVLNG